MLLLVTVFAVWLRWELSYVRERRAIVARLSVEEPGFKFAWLSDVSVNRSLGNFKYPTIPIWRDWLRDEPMVTIIVPSYASSEGDIENLDRLFPEADFLRWDRFLPEGESPRRKSQARQSMFSW